MYVDAGALALQLDHPESRAHSLLWGAVTRQVCGDVDAARRTAAEGAEHCASHGIVAMQRMLDFLHAWAMKDPEAGYAALAAKLLPMQARKRRGFFIPYYCCLMGDLAIALRRKAEGIAIINYGLEIAEATGELSHYGYLRVLEGKLQLLGPELTGDRLCGVQFWVYVVQEANARLGAQKRYRAGAMRPISRRAEGTGPYIVQIYYWFTEGLDLPDL